MGKYPSCVNTRSKQMMRMLLVVVLMWWAYVPTVSGQDGVVSDKTVSEVDALTLTFSEWRVWNWPSDRCKLVVRIPSETDGSLIEVFHEAWDQEVGMQSILVSTADSDDTAAIWLVAHIVQSAWNGIKPLELIHGDLDNTMSIMVQPPHTCTDETCFKATLEAVAASTYGPAGAVFNEYCHDLPADEVARFPYRQKLVLAVRP
jgi:hypothetical protein